LVYNSTQFIGKEAIMRWSGAATILMIFLGLTNWPVAPAFAADAAPKPEELLVRHLDSIGSAEARAAVKDRVVQGTASYRILVGGAGKAEGKTGFVSEEHKLRFLLKLPYIDYRGESIVFNGEAVGVAFANTNQSRSPFASFISTQDVILRDGLLGGVLSTAWPLLNLADRKAQLIVEGLKKVDGRQLYQVRYQPAKHMEAVITLFFEPETFRHVKTVYATSVANNVGATITESSKLLPERTTLEERFSDFKTVDGLNLPTHWNLLFTRELPNGSTSVTEWDLKEDQITNNMGLDPRNFEVK
jgi:hypothetical protein